MKQSVTCPKCSGKKLYVVERATLPAHDSINGTEPLTVAAAWLPTGESGFLGAQHARYLARVEAWVCAACGYTELYTAELGNLAYMAQQGKAGVRVVDSAATRGPFR
jgi:predicted nucleic-acid-binding Zn-ribbon protein